MNIKFGDKVFEVPDSCPINGPKKRRLIRHLDEHGLESLLTSKSLEPYSQCILNEILEAGGEPAAREEKIASSDESLAQLPIRDV